MVVQVSETRVLGTQLATRDAYNQLDFPKVHHFRVLEHHCAYVLGLAYCSSSDWNFIGEG